MISSEKKKKKKKARKTLKYIITHEKVNLSI